MSVESDKHLNLKDKCGMSLWNPWGHLLSNLSVLGREDSTGVLGIPVASHIKTPQASCKWDILLPPLPNVVARGVPFPP